MKKTGVLLFENYCEKPLFVMIMRLFLENIYNFSYNELAIIYGMIEDIFNIEKIVNIDKIYSDKSLIHILSAQDAIKKEFNEDFISEEFFDYSTNKKYSIFSSNYNSENNFYNFSEAIEDNPSFDSYYINIKIHNENNEKNIYRQLIENNVTSKDYTEIDNNYEDKKENYHLEYSSLEQIASNHNIKIYIENKEIEEKKALDFNLETNNSEEIYFLRIYEKNETVNNNSSVNFTIFPNNNLQIELNNLSEIKEESLDSLNVSSKIQIKNHNKIENSSIIVNSKESINNLNINYEFKFYVSRVIRYNEVNDNKFFDSEEAEMINNEDFESEITPCLDIDFSPKRIQENRYSLLKGGLELKVSENDVNSSAIFGVKDKNLNSSRIYNTTSNEISALLFKAFEEKGVSMDFEIENNKIHLKDVSGTRIFMEDNEKFSVNNISYKIIIKDKYTNEEIKNIKLDDKLSEGNYIIDVIAEVDYDARLNKMNSNVPPIFSVMKRNEKNIRAYCINECGFETNGKETILDQIIKTSKEKGYNLEVKTMDTIAENKLRAKSLTYINNIEIAKEEYLKLHPTAKKDKIGILYLVFDDNNKVLGEVGYRDEGLDYVAKKGLKIKPVIYELGANIKDAYAKINNAI